VRLPIVAPGGEGGTPSFGRYRPAGPRSRGQPDAPRQYRVPERPVTANSSSSISGRAGGRPGLQRRTVGRPVRAGERQVGGEEDRTLTAGGMKVLVIETAGTYLAGSMIGGQVERKPGWALLGAVVEGRTRTGTSSSPAEGTVDAQRSAFDGLLKSLKRGG